ncbi:MAG: CRISPR-associated endonuclease Cas2 [Candidatus Poribacteria bacterium]|nr:CRISPR-associated endonuclease Cas2 [Candidatus Poribacteria bacterium]
MLYAVAYDITNDRRRNQVAKILLDFGRRIQYSLFECNTDRRAYLRLQDRLQDAINPKKDTVTFYHLCRSCEKGIERLGIEKGIDTAAYIV